MAKFADWGEFLDWPDFAGRYFRLSVFLPLLMLPLGNCHGSLALCTRCNRGPYWQRLLLPLSEPVQIVRRRLRSRVRTGLRTRLRAKLRSLWGRACLLPVHPQANCLVRELQ